MGRSIGSSNSELTMLTGGESELPGTKPLVLDGHLDAGAALLGNFPDGWAKYLPGHLWAWFPVMWPSGAT